MDRAQIMQQIAELDKQINSISASNRVPSLNSRNQAFPLSSWIAVVALAALGLFGGTVYQPIVQYGWIALAMAGLFALFAVYRTFMWLVKGGQKKDKKYVAAMEQVAGLQKKREELQKALNAAG